MRRNHDFNASGKERLEKGQSIHTIHKPFPQQVTHPGVVKPNHISQEELNESVKSYYNHWKMNYLKNDLSSLPGGYYVKGEITGNPEGFTPLGTSEGQGYGMVITVLMAGYDSAAQSIYNGLFKTAKTFKSSRNPNLMGWIVTDDKKAFGYFPSATDGDLDIAYSLLLAHTQWGSTGAINYLKEAQQMITEGIKKSIVTINNRLNLGDWDKNTTLNTRSSDWMMSHFRAFYEFTNDQIWLNIINNLYNIYKEFSAKYSPNTGLVSDFVVDSPPQPAPENFLNESEYTGAHYYNASRVPLRIVMDYAMYSEKRSKIISDQISTWIRNQTNDNPSNIVDGYHLNGSVIGSYATAVFVSPFIAASITNSINQDWVNCGWDWMKNKKESYYSDSYNLLTMLFVSGNWWKPVPGDRQI